MIVHVGSAPLGSYTPMKVPTMNATFELGVTRSPTFDTTDTLSTNGGPTSTAANNNASSNANGHNGSGGALNAASNAAADLSESLQYLKPATDDQTVAWSEGTRVTDLLF